MKIAAVVVAGGSGRRLGGPPKQFRPLAGRAMLEWSLRLFEASPEVAATVLVVPPDAVADALARFPERAAKLAAVVAGGAERRDSVRLGLDALPEGTTHVLVHDAARPLASPALVARVSSALTGAGAAVPVVPVTDTLKRVAGGFAAETVDRSALSAAQTPQGFEAGLLRRAHARASGPATDDAMMVEALGEPVAAVEGDPANFKVTTEEDLRRAEDALARREGLAPAMRVGHGFDVHRLVEGRPLILGGVRIDHPKGLLGHSDADALLHAIGDAVLGACGARDLGAHFPDTDPKWKGADSRDLLRACAAMAAERGWRVANVDGTVVAQRPKLAPHIPAMTRAIADCLGVPEGAVNVKATTTEGLGYEGREEGIGAHAVCLLRGWERRA